MLSLRPPRHSSSPTTENSGINANNVIAATIPLNNMLMNVRGRRSDRSNCEKSTPRNGSNSSALKFFGIPASAKFFGIPASAWTSS